MWFILNIQTIPYLLATILDYLYCKMKDNDYFIFARTLFNWLLQCLPKSLHCLYNSVLYIFCDEFCVFNPKMMLTRKFMIRNSTHRIRIANISLTPNPTNFKPQVFFIGQTRKISLLISFVFFLMKTSPKLFLS